MKPFLLGAVFPLIFTLGCSGNMDAKATLGSQPQDSQEAEQTPPPPEEPPRLPVSDEDIPLDSYGEQFQARIAKSLQNSRYMEGDCQSLSSWREWENLPLKRCSYRSGGQEAEVLMLNPGPRRLTLWLEDACKSLRPDFESCMDQAFKQILYQSGGQFPVAGVVVEDMDGNGRGNAYAFRNGVTIQVAAFGTGTEQVLSRTQVSRAFTDTPIKTYTYGRPISLTREELTTYARDTGLTLPDLGSSSERLNIYNVVLGDLYRQAWRSSQNHIIRAWVYSSR